MEGCVFSDNFVVEGLGVWVVTGLTGPVVFSYFVGLTFGLAFAAAGGVEPVAGVSAAALSSGRGFFMMAAYSTIFLVFNSCAFR